MGSLRKLALGVLACMAGSVAAWAQSAVISARSGLIHYVEGDVYLANQPVETKFGTFPEVKENQELKTAEGRAEILLTPGVFLRLGESSSFRMITNRLIDTRLELLQGAAVVEADEIGKDNSVTVVYQDATVHPTKKGVYRLDASAGEMHVYDGEAEVAAHGQTVEVKEGHVISLDTLAVHKFDKTTTDALNRWSERRASYVSMANVGAANTLRASIYDASNPLGAPLTGGWYWNSMFGMYSFVPGMGGMFYSAYGFPYFSPFDVDMAFMPGFYYMPYPYGYGYGYGSGYGSRGNYGNVYNSVITKTVPTPIKVGLPPSHNNPAIGGSTGSLASGRPSVSSIGSYAPPSTSMPVSHVGAVGAGVSSPHK